MTIVTKNKFKNFNLLFSDTWLCFSIDVLSVNYITEIINLQRTRRK